jgi:TonB-dependent receptor
VATLDASGNPTGTGAILPNFTDTFTEARPVAGSQFQMIANRLGQLQRQRTVQFVADHKRDRLQINFDANMALGFLDQTMGQDTPGKTGGNFTTTITGVGWILDSSKSREFPTFTQTSGPSVYDINNYRNSIINQLGNSRHNHIYSAKIDLRYEMPTRLRSYLKTGLSVRRQDSIQRTWNNTRYTYAGPNGVVGDSDDTLAPFRDTALRRSSEFGLGDLPFVHVGMLGQSVKDNPNYWVEDVYFRESQNRAGTNSIYEGIAAIYLMGGTRWDKLAIFGGARFEETNLSSSAWVIQRSLTTITDPLLRVATEYSSRSIKGDYSNLMPSLHCTYTIQPRLIARASYSTGISRPPLANLVPTESVNDTARTVTTSNPSLKPQFADNWDFSLEYYMKQLGLVSIGLFEKDLKNFIFSSSNGVIGTGNDNGFNGQYQGYTIQTSLNGGKARVRGIELNYQQQLAFGPSWVRSIGVFANYTRLNTSGDYGTGRSQSVSALAEFIPTSWNLGARWSRGPFRTNVLFNYTGEYLFTYSTIAPRLLYKEAFKNTTLSLSYALKPSIEIYWDAYNLFSESQRWYLGVPGHLQAYSIKGTMLSFGVRGRF